MKLNFNIDSAVEVTPLDKALEDYYEHFGVSACIFPIDGSPVFKDVDSAIKGLYAAISAGVPIESGDVD